MKKISTLFCGLCIALLLGLFCMANITYSAFPGSPFGATYYFILSQYYSVFKDVHYVSNDSSITDHTDATVLGSYAWVRAQVGSNYRKVCFPPKATPYLFPSDYTTSAYTEISILPGAVLSVASGKTLTISSFDSAAAGMRQCFSGDGSVVFASAQATDYVMSSWFGTIGDDGTTDNKAQLNAALASLKAGMTLVVPKASGYYKVTNTVSGITSSIDDVNIRIDGTIKSTAADKHMLTVTGNRTRIYGTGTIQGPGIFEQTDAGYNYWSLIRFYDSAANGTAARDCEVSGLNFVDPVTTGVLFQTVIGGTVRDCVFTGGPTVKTGTAGFGVTMKSSAKVTVDNNRFRPSSTGGRLNTGIYGGTTTTLTDPDGETSSWNRDHKIINNVSEGLFQHCVYMYGNRCLIHGNTDKGSMKGLITAVGVGNIVSENHGYGTYGGISMGSSSYSIVRDNLLYDCKYADSHGIHFRPYTDGPSMSNNIVSGNRIYSVRLAGIKFEPISGGLTATDMDNNQIIDNYIYYAGTKNNTSHECHGIRYSETSVIKNRNIIKGNIISSPYGMGMSLLGLNDSVISDNVIYKVNLNGLDAWGIGISLNTCTYCTIANNRITHAVGGELNITIDENGTSDYNLIVNNVTIGANTDYPVYRKGDNTRLSGNIVDTYYPSGTCTLTANAASTVVANKLVTAESQVILTPTSANAAADVAAGNVYVSALTEGTGFTITHPNNANADKTFHYLIIN